MTTPRDEVHLLYIVESIDLIRRYTTAGREGFDRDRMVQDAVLRRLETLADAASKLPRAVKDRHPAIPWHDLHGFRNVAAHAYTRVELEIVWRIVEEDLGPLRAVAAEELQRIGRQPQPER